jgi:hypothetical protein
MDWMARLRKRDRMEAQRKRKLEHVAQKLKVVDRLPEVERAVFSFGGRRRKLNSIAKGAKQA